MKPPPRIPQGWIAGQQPEPAADLGAASCDWRMQGGSVPPRRIIRMPLPFCSISSARPLCSTTSAQGPSLPKSMLGASSSPASARPGGPGKEPEERVLITEVELQGVEGDLRQVALRALRTRPNFAYSIGEIRKDVERIFNTGWFQSCVPEAVDTREGVKLVIKVKPNDAVLGMVASGADTLPNKVVQRAFRDMHGKTLNFVRCKEAIHKLDRWYSERGVLGHVSDFNVRDGIIHLDCAEAVVGEIKLQFQHAKTSEAKDKPRTRPEVVLRHLTTQPGRVYNLAQAKRDVSSIYSTGLFEDVNITPSEASDSTEAHPKVDLLITLPERKSGGLGGGGGLAHGGGVGFVGNVTYSEKNLFGRNQSVSAQAEFGQVEKMFQLIYADPWLSGDQHRTSRTISFMNNRSSGSLILGTAETAASGSSSPASTADVHLGRLVGGVDVRRPLSAHWAGTLALHCQRIKCMDEHGRPISRDMFGSPLTFSGKPHDDMALASASATYSNPEDGSQLMASAEQAVSYRDSWLSFMRLRMRADKSISLGPLSLNLKAKAGHVAGQLPPYEAFPIGGTNSVRGYAEGSVGSGRSWVEGGAELRFPVVSALTGCLFFDYGTDLGSGATVLGNPAGTRNKPGSGYGYGAGVCMDTMLGPLRLEYALNDKRAGRFHVGIGYE